MNYDIIKLHDEVLKTEKKLNLLVDNTKAYEKLLGEAIKKDGIFSKYIATKQFLEIERSKLIKKYEKKINMPFKNEIIAQIRTEVRASYPNIGVKELLHFSINIFIYCTLNAYNINEQEIVNELVNLNNLYFQEIEKDDKIEKNTKLDCTLEYLQYLNEKYTKIIKEKI